MAWRYISDDSVTASFGLAADEALTRRQGTAATPSTLRLYTYASHCALTPTDGLPRSYDRIRDLFQRFGAGLIAALATLGVTAEYRRKNDIEVGARGDRRARARALRGRELDLPGTTVKTPGGLVSAHLTLAGDVIKVVYLTEDFFCEEAAVMGIERALRWHATDPIEVTATLRELAAEGGGLPQISPEEIARVVGVAVDAARRHEQRALAKGCFVNP